jgi:hypothetical protein
MPNSERGCGDKTKGDILELRENAETKNGKKIECDLT